MCDWIHCFVGQVQCHKVRLSVAFERGSFFTNTYTSLDSVKTMHRFAWICDPETGYSGCVPLKAGFSLMSKSSMDSWGCGVKNITALTALTATKLRLSWHGSSFKDAAKAPNEAARIVKNVQAEHRQFRFNKFNHILCFS